MLPSRALAVVLFAVLVLALAVPTGALMAYAGGGGGLGLAAGDGSDSPAVPGEGGSQPTGEAQDGPSGGSPTASPADPFEGTPAAKWAAGADGVAVPAAAATGPWQAKDVAVVLAKAKQAQVAARLSSQVLNRGTPSAYLALLAPSTRTLVTDAIAKGEPGIGYVTRLAHGYTLAGPIRVSGSLAVSIGAAQQLIVTADVVWAYPLAGPMSQRLSGPGAKVVVLRTSETYEWYSPAKFGVADRGLRPGAAVTAYGNMDCGQVKKGLIGLPMTDVGGVSPEALFDSATKPDELPTTC